jgi:hypothetical protein
MECLFVLSPFRKQTPILLYSTTASHAIWQVGAEYLFVLSLLKMDSKEYFEIPIRKVYKLKYSSLWCYITRLVLVQINKTQVIAKASPIDCCCFDFWENQPFLWCGAGVKTWKNISRLITLLKVLSIDVSYLFTDCYCSTFDITMCMGQPLSKKLHYFDVTYILLWVLFDKPEKSFL